MKNKLLKLYADNRYAPLRDFKVVNTTDGVAEVYLYDAIVDDELEAEYYGGIAPQSFVKALKAIKADTIHLRINSPGGSVFAARAMETALREHPANVIVHIDGLAASAATFIAMAGDQVRMAPGAMFMIHKAWTIAFGNSDDLVNTADLLDKIDGTLAETYAARTGMDKQKCMDMMAAETWMTAQEALNCGFVDSVGDPDQDGDSKKKDPDGPDDKFTWNLSAYEHAPAAAAKSPVPAPAAPAANESATVSKAALLRRLEAAAIIP